MSFSLAYHFQCSFVYANFFSLRAISTSTAYRYQLESTYGAVDLNVLFIISHQCILCYSCSLIFCYVWTRDVHVGCIFRSILKVRGLYPPTIRHPASGMLASSISIHRPPLSIIHPASTVQHPPPSTIHYPASTIGYLEMIDDKKTKSPGLAQATCQTTFSAGGCELGIKNTPAKACVYFY